MSKQVIESMLYRVNKLRECSLAIIDTDSRTRIIQNFLVAKKVEGRAG
jgi:hypothetical protein